MAVRLPALTDPAAGTLFLRQRTTSRWTLPQKTSSHGCVVPPATPPPGAGSVLEWNRRAETMFGRRREDVLGHDLTDLVVPERLRATNPFALAEAETSLQRPHP